MNRPKSKTEIILIENDRQSNVTWKSLLRRNESNVRNVQSRSYFRICNSGQHWFVLDALKFVLTLTHVHTHVCVITRTYINPHQYSQTSVCNNYHVFSSLILMVSRQCIKCTKQKLKVKMNVWCIIWNDAMAKNDARAVSSEWLLCQTASTLLGRK